MTMDIDHNGHGRTRTAMQGEGGDAHGTDKYAGFLSPLQQSLVYELTTRRAEIKRQEQLALFWQEQEEQEEKQRSQEARKGTQFSDLVLDDAFYDEQIASRRKELQRKREAAALKVAIIDSADAAHAINASMAAVPPAPSSSRDGLPLSMYNVTRQQQPLRSIVAQRDKLALEFLQIDAQIKKVRKERQDVLRDITALRSETSATVAHVRSVRANIQAQKAAVVSGESMHGRAKNDAAHGRIVQLQEALKVARGKREMVKGVLRGLILESGLDWMGNDDLRNLVMALGDDCSDSSDEDEEGLDAGGGNAQGEEEDSRDETRQH